MTILRTARLDLPLSFKRWLMILLFLPLVGCEEARKDQELNAFIEQIKMRQGAPIVPMPALAPIPHFVYPDQGRRDIFSPSQNKKIIRDVNLPDQNRPREVLEAYGLDALHFVGVLNRDTQTWALIESPDGVVHRLQVGNYVGKDYGVISNIGKDKLTLIESIQTESGWEKRTTEMDIVN